MTRPKGSKSKSKTGYSRRAEEMKLVYGPDIYKVWGKKGGNPALLKEKQ
jgi:hypothetical protein